MPRRFIPLARRASTALLLSALAVSGLVVVGGSEQATDAAAPVAAKARKANVVTPGDFTGFGFDQCQAPSQAKMNRWLRASPFWAVGIYIAGDSRACRNQTYLNATWVSTQLAKGWRLLPITLGPQASCQPRFPRYKDDFRISSKANTNGAYTTAARQGRTQAAESVTAAIDLGISAGSTLWYDLEGFDSSNVKCRESALSFLSGWTDQLHTLGYFSGVYSSAGSGIRALDDARVERPGTYVLPDQIWIARWDGVANTSTRYIRSDGWMPRSRVKQYRGGHDETWGKVTINIDSNFLNLGRGSVADPEVHCGGVNILRAGYRVIRPANGTSTPDPAQVKALQCLLQEQGSYNGPIQGRYTAATAAAANSWQSAHGLPVTPGWTRQAWVALLSEGNRVLLKFGSAGPDVRRVQRALSAAGTDATAAAVRTTGVFNWKTDRALRAYQQRIGVPVNGIAGGPTWAALQSGKA
ncbi:glycoside hydrolase domain-containing protein [Nocardioides hankookensis]